MAESQTGPPAKIDIPRMLGDAYPAFKKLQEWGCGDDLGSLVLVVHLASVPSNRGNGRKLQLHRADSHELLLNGMSLKKARNLITQARNALNKFTNALTPLDGARIWQHTSIILVYKDEALQFLNGCLDSLSDALDNTGAKVHPSINRSIDRLVRYVHEKTGQYHDSEVAEVICAAIGNAPPPGYPIFPSAEALKTWRMVRGLSDSKTT